MKHPEGAAFAVNGGCVTLSMGRRSFLRGATAAVGGIVVTTGGAAAETIVLAPAAVADGHAVGPANRWPTI